MKSITQILEAETKLPKTVKLDLDAELGWCVGMAQHLASGEDKPRSYKKNPRLEKALSNVFREKVRFGKVDENWETDHGTHSASAELAQEFTIPSRPGETWYIAVFASGDWSWEAEVIIQRVGAKYPVYSSDYMTDEKLKGRYVVMVELFDKGAKESGFQ